MPLLSSILLVDDDRTANFLHQRLVTSMGIAGQVLVAEDGQQALATLAGARVPPALILLDLNMPVLNGLDFPHVLHPAAARYPVPSRGAPFQLGPSTRPGPRAAPTG